MHSYTLFGEWFFFFFKQKTAYEMLRSLVGSEMCIRDRLCTGLRVSAPSPVHRSPRFIPSPLNRYQRVLRTPTRRLDPSHLRASPGAPSPDPWERALRRHFEDFTLVHDEVLFEMSPVPLSKDRAVTMLRYSGLFANHSEDSIRELLDVFCGDQVSWSDIHRLCQSAAIPSPLHS
eukprot:TRINITY_DN15853_c0_g1_i2.p1 TRINITY_DN15853_c0_g1~~TRINITY_DN15853_c0_g1_i2.p1  ORF type:complete len:175 (+),score=33.63 TRINITY_DN15853_c0_g1_i2:83-607(+)